MGHGEKSRRDEWTDSIAVGSKPLVERVKALLGFRAKGRDIIECGEWYQVREGEATYRVLFGGEKGDIRHRNTYFWNVNNE
jgi:putative transposase